MTQAGALPTISSARGRVSAMVALFCGAIAAIVIPVPAASEALKFPNRPIQLIVPYAAGGATDAVARLLQQGMEKRLGQPILVINRPGASTTLGTQQVARAAPDGHTIVMVSVPHVANYTLLKEMPYTQSDFVPITPVTNTPNVLVVNPALPIKSVADLIAYIKARPGEVNYGTFGIGTSAHLAALLFEAKIGTKIQAVHYRGGAPAAVGVMTGEVQFAFGTPLSVAGGIDGGKLRPIAITSDKRINIYRDVPTVREQGLDYINGAWFGILAPARTPAPIVRQLLDAITGTMQDPAVQKTVADSGTEAFVTSPEAFAQFIAEETKMWAGVLKGISVDPQ
jgi:tripartite-type tricarboxylate transporter receptor subunit TctC